MECSVGSLTFLVVFILNTPYAQSGWENPAFSSYGNLKVDVTEQGNCVVEIDEKVTDVSGVLINYSGSTDFTIELENPEYQLAVQFEETTNLAYIIFKKTPDYDNVPINRAPAKFTLIDSNKESRDCFAQLLNVDDNSPQIIPLSDSNNCSVKENFSGRVDSCKFLITDKDGCEAKTIVNIASQGSVLSQFSLAFSPGTETEYPACLQKIGATSNGTEAVLQVDTALDYETAINYFLTLSTTDGGGNSGGTAVQVLQVLDEPDKPPVWQTITSTLTVEEEKEEVYKVSARDGDTQINSPICYFLQVEDGLTAIEENYFKIDKVTGDLSIGAIDRDQFQRNSYTLNLIAEECSDDNSEVSYIMVVQVLDSKNKNLTFSIDGVEGVIEYPPQSVPENSIAILNPTVWVYDPDQGNNGTFTAKTDDTRFIVLPSSGFQNATFTIQGTTLLDYEDKENREIYFNLIITEKQDATHVLEIPININVINQNDNAPIFDNVGTDSAIHFKVFEDDENREIGTVTATDLDEGDIIKYGMVNYAGVSVDQSTGVFSISGKPFDYEQQPQVQIQVTASDDGNTHTTYVSLLIDIQDVNDTPPTIRVQTTGSIEVEENAALGSHVEVEISATDRDTDADLSVEIDWASTLGYKNNIQVTNTSLFDGWFDVTGVKIDENKSDITVNVTVAQDLHWEVVDSIQLRIQVKDRNTKSGYQDTEIATITILIKDVNDHSPEFAEVNCGLSGTMQEQASLSQTIGTVVATDKDGPGNNNIIYSTAEPTEKRVTVNSVTGLISTGTTQVDYESDESISVIIQATDGDDNHIAICTVSIEVTDINDVVPIATPDLPQVNIPENVRNGHVAYINGFDGDKTEEFRTMRFSLNSFPNYFSLVDFLNGTAEVIVNVTDSFSFDYDEGAKEFSLVVEVRDNPEFAIGGKQNSNTTTIRVGIEDVNDNPPIFETGSDDTCLFSVSELTGQTTTLTGEKKLVATDKDSGENAWISYSIGSVECVNGTMKVCPTDKDNMFAISGNTNIPTANVKADVTSKSSLTDRYGDYIVNITAEDHGQLVLSASKTYRFCIFDENNHAPEFEYPNVTAITIRQDENGKIVEDTTGQPIPFIKAFDPDFKSNGDVVYNVVNGTNYLSIENGNELTVQGDFSEFIETTVLLQACDSSVSDQKCVTKLFTVRPRFTFEVEPVFTNSTFYAEMTENSTTELVVIPEAQDRNNDNVEDSSNLQKIYYYIISGTPEVTEFALDSETRQLTLKNALDAYIQNEYNIQVQVSNKADPATLPTPNPSSLLNITLMVIDINDKFPIFIRPFYTLSISITDKGKSVLTVVAEDPDRGDTVTYAIDPASVDSSHLDAPIGEMRVFSIDPTSGAVKVEDYPSQATSGYISFNVSASDGIHTSYAVVTVYVVSERFLIPAQFQNTDTEVAAHLNEVVDTFSRFFKLTCVPGQILNENAYSTLQVHFEDDNLKPVAPSSLDVIRNNLTAIKELKQTILDNYQLLLVRFIEDGPVENDPQGVNTALIAVSVVLAVLLVALAALYVFKTRSLSSLVNRLTKASTPDSDKKAFALPNTNQHTNIGSNPVWNTEVVQEYDNVSTTSSDDSGLIGIEDNPEFQTFYNDVILKAAGKVNVSPDDRILQDNPQLRSLTFDGDIIY